MRLASAAVAISLGLIGCAASPAIERLCDPHLDAPEGQAEAAAQTAPRSRLVSLPDADDRWRVRTLASEADGEFVASRPRRVGRRDIHLHQASLANAVRLIAQSGGFNVIVGDELAESVTVALRSVEPYDALLALAHAHGAEVDYDGSIVMVRRASASDRSARR